MRPERSKWENKIFYLKRHGTLTNEDDLRFLRQAASSSKPPPPRPGLSVGVTKEADEALVALKARPSYFRMQSKTRTSSASTTMTFEEVLAHITFDVTYAGGQPRYTTIAIFPKDARPEWTRREPSWRADPALYQIRLHKLRLLRGLWAAGDQAEIPNVLFPDFMSATSRPCRYFAALPLLRGLAARALELSSSSPSESPASRRRRRQRRR